MRTPVKYYGGKTRMLPHLLPLIPRHRIYLEAFAGGAALFFAKRPAPIEILNDVNGNVVNFYRVIQSHFEELNKLIQGTLHCEHTFNQAKEIYHSPEGHGAVQRAWAFWVSSNMAWGGEVGGSFQFVLHSSDNWRPAVSISSRRKEFSIYKAKLEKVTIRNRKAEELIPKYDQQDLFVYSDPPYVGARQGHYAGYTQEKFNSLLKVKASMKGRFLMSSYENKELSKYVEEYGWQQKRIEQRLGVVSSNQRKIEVLTWNYDLPKELTLFS